MGKNEKVAMYHMSYKENHGGITYLYKFKPGVCDNSHGLHCAELAGIPHEMLVKAKEKADMLHDRMHSNQTFHDERRLILDFENMMRAMIRNEEFQHIQTHNSAIKNNYIFILFFLFKFYL